MPKCTIASMECLKTEAIAYVSRKFSTGPTYWCKKCIERNAKREINPWGRDNWEGWYYLDHTPFKGRPAFLDENPLKEYPPPVKGHQVSTEALQTIYRRELLGEWRPVEKIRLQPLETAILGVNKRVMPSHERMAEGMASKGRINAIAPVTKSAVAQAIEKKNITYYWNPEYVGDGYDD